MNWPNRLTLLRLILIPFIVVLVLVSYYMEILENKWRWYIEIGDNFKMPILFLTAGILFVIASFTDFLDGYIARKYKQETDFGKFFDPIADKLLVNSVLILFAVTKTIPVWATIILILRDIFIDFIRTILAKRNITLAADVFGKLKTIFQMIGLTILFFVSFIFFDKGSEFSKEFNWLNQVLMIPLYIAVLFSIISGINYFVKSKKHIFQKEKEQAKA